MELLGQEISDEEYIGILEDYIVSKQSLEDFMREYPFYFGKSMKKWKAEIWKAEIETSGVIATSEGSTSGMETDVLGGTKDE